MQRHAAAEHIRRPALGIAVRHATGAARAVVEFFGKLSELAFVFIIAAFDGERHAPAFGHDDATGDDFDFAFVDFAGG